MASALEDFSPDSDINPKAHVGNVGQEDEEEVEEEDSDDGFCILEHPDREPDHLSHEVIIKSLTGQPVNIVENHFSIPVGSVKVYKALSLGPVVQSPIKLILN